MAAAAPCFLVSRKERIKKGKRRKVLWLLYFKKVTPGGELPATPTGVDA